ncbi:MAG: hypothetical protein AB7E79_05480 [Rhodospirillaceae bacterium]
MEKKAFFRLSVAAIAAGAAVFALARPVHAAEAQLIWSATSALVNQSTEALEAGRHAHAIRFAKDALRSKTGAANHLIARHNLCLAYIAQGKGAEAKPFCDLALATQARYQMSEQNGRWVVSHEESANDAATLAAAVRINVARAQGSARAENR